MVSKRDVLCALVILTVSLAAFVPGALAETAQKPRLEYDAAGAVRAVAMSADGALTVAGTADGNVHLFNNGSSTPLWSHAAGSAVNAVGISSDGSKMAAGTEAGKVLLFNRGAATPVWSAGWAMIWIGTLVRVNCTTSLVTTFSGLLTRTKYEPACVLDEALTL